MNKAKSNFLKMIRHNRRTFLLIIGILWLAFTVLVINIIKQPVEIVEEIKENTIKQETMFTYKADLIPYSLNPSGGVSDVKEDIFTKVTKDIILHISTQINAEEPVSIDGTKEVVLKLVAEDLWEKEYLLSKKTSFSMEGTENKVIDEDFTINIGELTGFMAVVEEEISARPGKYTFKIKPSINGIIRYDGKEFPIADEAETFIDYSQTQITIGEENEFTKTTPIIKNIAIPQEFNIMGKGLPVKTARYIIGSIYLALFILLMIKTRNYIIKEKSILTEVQMIDKKYKARLINVKTQEIKIEADKIILDSIKSLIRISDEKEISIFRYEEQDKVEYYVMDEGYVFLYETDNNTKTNLKLQNDTI